MTIAGDIECIEYNLFLNFHIAVDFLRHLSTPLSTFKGIFYLDSTRVEAVLDNSLVNTLDVCTSFITMRTASELF